MLADEIAALLPRMRRFARALTFHREDADDLVQIAMERALGRRAAISSASINSVCFW